MSSFRARRQWVPLAVGLGLMVFTVANAGVQAQAVQAPTDDELVAQDLLAIKQARQVKIAELFAASSGVCEVAVARELAQLLVLDGQFDAATAYSASYDTRCGGDPIVQKWGHAPRGTKKKLRLSTHG